ncbi:MAG: glycosyltransferase family 4 protein [Cyanobacteria bacterium P01_F01_bin.33]
MGLNPICRYGSKPGSSMNVLLFGYCHGQGGIQTHTKNLTEGLRERGHKVSVISPQPMAAHEEVDLCQDVSEYQQSYSSFFELVRLVRSRHVDVAVVTGTGWLTMAGALLLPRPCRRVFFEVMSGARNRNFDPRSLVHFGFDAVVGQGSPVTRRFIDEFGWRDATATIPALPEPLERRTSIPRQNSRDVSEGVRFAHFGRLAAHKNVRLLVDRFKDYAPDGSTLDIWGEGPDLDLIARSISQNGLNNHITLRGRYPDGQAYVELLQSYDLKLLPTVGEEGAPLVLLEAMACGLPFVANGVGGIPDYTNPDCVVTDGDIRNFVSAVTTMVHRLQSGNINQSRLQRCYDASFRFTRLVDRWEGLLMSIVHQVPELKHTVPGGPTDGPSTV